MVGKLNPKQEAFCMHYAHSGNATEAYKEAGYACKTPRATYAAASRLMEKPKIQARLQELAEQIASEKIATVREVQEYLTSVMRRQVKEHIVVTFPQDGNTEVVEIPAKVSDANKAAELLAKMQGGFDTKHQIELLVPKFGGEDDLED